MTEWFHNRMLALDCETTDKDPETCRMVSVAVALVGGGQETDGFAKLINPGVPVEKEAEEAHGLSAEHLAEHGLDPAVVLPGVLSALSAAVDAGFAVVAFNARFDLTVADRELRRLGIVPDALWERIRVVDPFVIDKHTERYRSGSRKLPALCEHYRANLEGAHDAMFDAVAAARVAYRLGTIGEVVRREPRSHDEARETYELRKEWARIRGDLDALHEAQRRWAYDEAVRLERYFHEGNPSKGVPPQPDRVVPREWPLIPADKGTPGAERNAGVMPEKEVA